jgi:hypothetical protein
MHCVLLRFCRHVTPLLSEREASCVLQLIAGDYTLIPGVFQVQSNANTSSNSTTKSNTALNGKLWLSCKSTAPVYITASVPVKHSSELSDIPSADSSTVNSISPWGQTCRIVNKPAVTEVSTYTHDRMLRFYSSI